MAFVYQLNRLTTREGLIEAIGIDQVVFQQVLDFIPPARLTARKTASAVLEIPPFVRHDIPKRNRNRGFRTVWEPLLPKPAYKALARRLDNYLRIGLPGYPHDCAYGYRSGRNIRENAFAHCGNGLLLSMDVQNFFPSIVTDKVRDLLMSVHINETVADLLARFLTIGGSLPLGLPTSPVISNAIAVPLDEVMERLADAVGSTYTRYSDDLSFSGDGGLPHVDAVTRALEMHGFKVAEQKTRISRLGQNHYVTGLSISDPVQPHVPKEKKRRLRQELYYAEKFGLSDHLRHLGATDTDTLQQEVNRLDGTVKFVAHHEPFIASRIKTVWRTALTESGLKTSFTPRGLRRAPFFLFADESEFLRDGRPFLALCITMTQHIEKIADDTKSFYTGLLNDIWMDGDVETLRAKGLHFTDATQDVRIAYIKELARMPFEGYVAYAPLSKPEYYEQTYLSLLSALIVRRLMSAESQYAMIYFEQNSKVSTAKVRACVENAFAGLEATNNRRPAAVFVDFVSKPNVGLGPPDFLLGVLGQYLSSKPLKAGKPEWRERLLFERLRDKYRLILDMEAGLEYSRRRPIEPWVDTRLPLASQSGVNPADTKVDERII